MSCGIFLVDTVMKNERIFRDFVRWLILGCGDERRGRLKITMRENGGVRGQESDRT